MGVADFMMKIEHKCESCHGTGTNETRICPTCHGLGYFSQLFFDRLEVDIIEKFLNTQKKEFSKQSCGTCKYFSKNTGHFGHTFCKHDAHCGDIVHDYTVCDYYEKRHGN